jgi:Retrotransposon gag protein
VSDSVIAPRPFTGKTSENDAESWLEFFELYCKHRGLNNSERLTLFPLMMRNGAADWLATLPKTQLQSYDSLVTAFRDNYFVPAELRWKEAGMLWNQSQREDEQVEDFVTRVRRGARRIKLADTQLVDIILNGLRPSIRLHVLQKGGDTLNDLIKTAKLAEAVAPVSNDTTNTLLLKYMQSNAQANERQSNEMKNLMTKIAALTEQNEQMTINALNPNQAREIRPQQNYARPTPQNQQRYNYARDFNMRTPQGSATGFEPRARVNFNQNEPECDRCGRRHGIGDRCVAVGLRCHTCQKLNHLAVKCRSGRRPLQQQQPPPTAQQQ